MNNICEPNLSASCRPIANRRKHWGELRLIATVACLLFAVGCAGEREKQELEKLRVLVGQTPVYPGFKNPEERLVMKPGKVALHMYYTSDSQFSEIKKFYDRVLPESGWGSPEQPPPSIIAGQPHLVSYRRGDYFIHLSQDEGRRDRFDVDFVWEPD